MFGLRWNCFCSIEFPDELISYIRTHVIIVGGVSNPIYTLICHELNKDVPVFYGK